MIISRPITSTVFSFVLFLLISFGLIGLSLVRISAPAPPWYSYLVLITLVPVTAYVAYKIIFGYKIIRYGNNQIDIRYPVLRKNKIYSLNEIEYWAEASVKTGKNSTFRELEIKFTDTKKIRVGLKEYSKYTDVIRYLEKKLARKKREQ